MGLYDKYVIRNPVIVLGELLTYHQKGAGPYSEYLNNTLVPETKMYLSFWKIEKVPEANPPCSIHSHKVEQFVLYVGEPETFEVLYNLVPPEVKLENDLMTSEHQYTITRTGGFYIPAGLRHNNYIVRVDKPPVYEITVMLQKAYD